MMEIVKNIKYKHDFLGEFFLNVSFIIFYFLFIAKIMLNINFLGETQIASDQANSLSSLLSGIYSYPATDANW